MIGKILFITANITASITLYQSPFMFISNLTQHKKITRFVFCQIHISLYFSSMDEIEPGNLLIADPFLKDPNFKRSVIIICDHQPSGSFGFVLNKEYPQMLSELISGLVESDFPVFYGGPVQKDTVHFLHQCPGLITGGHEISEGIYWGGDFTEVVELLNTHQITNKDIRFFLGYSGWGEGQLEDEMKQKSWITSAATKKLIFTGDTGNIWKDALKQLGGEYQQMVNYPIDPQLN